MPKHRPNRAKRNTAAWLQQYPELSTRPHLVSAMVTGHRLRARFFESAAALDAIVAGLPKGVAIKCLNLWWSEMRNQLYVYWHDKLREQSGSDALFNELFGCLRNVFYNRLVRAGSRSPIRYSEHDVRSGSV